MPFAQTWSEELIAEWLELKGFAIQVGLPVSTSGPGGPFCADVVGARIKQGKLEIVHVEVGSLTQNVKDSLTSLGKKFSPSNVTAIENFFKERFEFSGSVSFKKMYIASFCSNPVKDAIESKGVEIHRLEDFIGKHVLPDISEWKKNWSKHTKTNALTLPESYWILKMIDQLNCNDMLKF